MDFEPYKQVVAAGRPSITSLNWKNKNVWKKKTKKIIENIQITETTKKVEYNTILCCVHATKRYTGLIMGWFALSWAKNIEGVSSRVLSLVGRNVTAAGEVIYKNAK